jgi:hypothetical protein
VSFLYKAIKTQKRGRAFSPAILYLERTAFFVLAVHGVFKHDQVLIADRIVAG